MADVAVDFLLNNLKDLLKYHVNLIGNAREEVEKLQQDLGLFQAFLKKIKTKQQREDPKIKEIVRQIRGVVYQAEDIIDAFLIDGAKVKDSSKFMRIFRKPVVLHSIATKVKRLKSRIEHITGPGKGVLEFVATTNIPDDSSKKIEAPIVRRENIVGFQEEATELIGYLKEEKVGLNAISIIGMPGVGKTTLAGKIYNDQEIQNEFPIRIWVYISQELNRKSIFLTILKELVAVVADNLLDSDHQKLAQEVSKRLQDKKFLIVMDDVWTRQDWDVLKTCLPVNNKGKVIITSRHVEVGNYACPGRVPHQLRLLTPEESWLLLQLEFFGKPECCPAELYVPGKLIVRECGNLPLAIVVIGGLLSSKVSPSADVSEIERIWKDVSKDVKNYIAAEDSTKHMLNIIGLSYDGLPHHLRACFLYLGMFTEDFDIPAWKLTRMWIGEGFIQKEVGYSLEVTAERYLVDLINRNLLTVDKRRRDGTPKICRCHDMLRDFCRIQGGKQSEDFLQEIKKAKGGSFEPLVSEIHKFRRICVHSHLPTFFESNPSGPHVRSFVHFSKEEIKSEIMSDIPAAFKLLRVLELKPILSIRYPKDLAKLIHLRYLVISLINLPIIPSVLSDLWNLQTFLVYTKSRTLAVEADIWNMKELRHFKTNASAILPRPANNSSECENITTLGTISPKSCTEVVFSKARYVKDLGIRGRLGMLLDSETGSFGSLEELTQLEKLKLINDTFPHPAYAIPLTGLLSHDQFPPNLRFLTLVKTFLDWEKMSILGQLKNLEVLKLKLNAFMGPTWVMVDGGFGELAVLCIADTNLETWTASEHHFPKLRSLELNNCKELQQVPPELAEVKSFKMLDLQYCEKAADSATEIRATKERMQTTESNAFKLTMFPHEK